MSEDEATIGFVRMTHSSQLSQKKGVRQPVKSIALNSQMLIPPRYRKLTGDARHRMMESGVETRDLRKLRIPLRKPFDQFNLMGKVFGIRGTQPL